ncbi:hypothetical protein M3A49_18095 [Paraburkholderia sp. CNPSo 3076]|uniref:hypothetical protein n=1 Tax=Paraburkholderia sp. CNPSo 3076 TaxID=2940936 RepID=UPI00225832B5|nr:hypothetical protein [Paraburkholderia sp. CNPSo 3076]MCX5541386.1 hypothetical protein [Paraburkholderia sp. CNPSo 3076]
MRCTHAIRAFARRLAHRACPGAAGTPDARCAATLRFARSQLERYAAMDTARRRMIQQRIRERVRERFAARQTPPDIEGACSIDIDVDNSEFETPEGFR